MSISKDDSEIIIFQEKALELEDSHEFENCDTFSQILDVLDKKEKNRKIQPREFYEGRRGGRKRFFFMC